MLFGESTVEDVSNIEQVFIFGDGFDGAIGTSPNLNKFNLQEFDGDNGTALLDGSGNVVLHSDTSSYDTIALMTNMKFNLGVQCIFREKHLNDRYPDVMIGNGQMHEDGAVGVWHPKLPIPSLFYSNQDVNVQSGSGLGVYDYYGKTAITQLYSGAWSPLLDTFYTHDIIWTDGLNKSSRDFTTTVVEYNDNLMTIASSFCFAQGNYAPLGVAQERTIDFIVFREYVATEPTISIGTAGANPEYDSGGTHVPNMLFGFNSSNF
jgi:hypothetical protein